MPKVRNAIDGRDDPVGAHLMAILKGCDVATNQSRSMQVLDTGDKECPALQKLCSRDFSL
ncbi:hypothetical protein J6590_028469 [Homalodisca vitripennis]|nr:hypothetical protein J6590_028469 [Homalodisca vitripennis]